MPGSSRRLVYDPSIASIDVFVANAPERHPVNACRSDPLHALNELQGLDPSQSDGILREDLTTSEEETMHRRKRQRRQRIVLSFVLLGASVAVVAVTIQRQLSSSSIQTTSSQSVQPPAANLQAICSQSFIQRSSPLKCEMACEVADCCDFPSSLGLSCLAGNEHVCMQYHQACYILNDDNNIAEGNSSSSEVPAAPDNLQQLCAPSGLATNAGFDACFEVCETAACCYQDSSSRKGGGLKSCAQHGVCAPYSPCLHLKAAHHVDVSISQEIKLRCSDTKELQSKDQRYSCAQACAQAALCCYPSKSVSESETYCPEDVTDYCAQYESCQVTLDEAAKKEGDSGTTTDRFTGNHSPQEDTDLITTGGVSTSGENGPSLFDKSSLVPSESWGSGIAGIPPQLGLDTGLLSPEVNNGKQTGASLEDICAFWKTFKECMEQCAVASCCNDGGSLTCVGRDKVNIVCDDYSACKVLYPDR